MTPLKIYWTAFDDLSDPDNLRLVMRGDDYESRDSSHKPGQRLCRDYLPLEYSASEVSYAQPHTGHWPEMPLNDCFQFWANAYSRPPTEAHTVLSKPLDFLASGRHTR